MSVPGKTNEIDKKTDEPRPVDGQAHARRFATGRLTYLRTATASAVAMTTWLAGCDTPAYG